MDLSNLVHTGRIQGKKQFQQHDSQPRGVITSPLVVDPYMAQDNHHKSKYSFVNAPQPPPSPPADETPKLSLPSISSLLGLVDTSSPQGSGQSIQSYGKSAITSHSKLGLGQVHKNNYFDSGHQKFAPSLIINSRGNFPLTPPLHSDSGFDGRQSSPSTISNSENSSSSISTYDLPPNLSSEIPANCQTELSDQRRRIPPCENRVSLLSQAGSNCSSLTNSNENHYRISPHQRMNPFHPTAMQQNQSNSPEVSDLSYQRPLPQVFSLSTLHIPASIPQYPSANPWQHHHYISPSSVASFPQLQDRYICQTCSKAFSRPSSLRIHSHSHTGAKPFKCPYVGCGKAFSVRSNMKRHERGCHSSVVTSIK